jgi:conjugative transfer signal peptidase TraF
MLTIIAMGVGCVLLSKVSGLAVLIYNPSPSAPMGFYRAVVEEPLSRGDWVLLDAPESVRRLASDRHYLPASVPMIKSVAALEGDRVCALGDTISVNGVGLARRLKRDHRGLTLPWWNGCETLGADDIFVLNVRVPASFDGRYFGVLKRGAVRARLVKL